MFVGTGKKWGKSTKMNFYYGVKSIMIMIWWGYGVINDYNNDLWSIWDDKWWKSGVLTYQTRDFDDEF